jgi:hypothetical protein
VRARRNAAVTRTQPAMPMFADTSRAGTPLLDELDARIASGERT